MDSEKLLESCAFLFVCVELLVALLAYYLLLLLRERRGVELRGFLGGVVIGRSVVARALEEFILIGIAVCTVLDPAPLRIEAAEGLAHVLVEREGKSAFGGDGGNLDAQVAAGTHWSGRRFRRCG